MQNKNSVEKKPGILSHERNPIYFFFIKKAEIQFTYIFGREESMAFMNFSKNTLTQNFEQKQKRNTCFSKVQREDGVLM